jgi:hypothetical protein
VDSGGVEAASAPETGATPAGDSGEDSGEDSGLEDAATVVDSGTAGIGNDAGVSDGGPEYCANLNTDPSNCGGCGMACGPNGLCSGGMCTVSCPTGQKGCPASGTCIPENTCCQSGECTITGEVCPTPGGTCACPAGERECAGTVMSCISDSACCTDADCNMNGVTGQKCTTPGTPCTCQTGLQCCVAADCPSVPNVATDACTVNKCSVASCVRGCYDLDMMFANGCECCDSVYGKTCATATAGGALTVGMTPLTYTGSIPEMGGSSLGDWFSVTFSGESNTAFHGLIQLTSGAGEFVFDILQSSCSGAPMACGTEGGSCTGKTAWEESYVGPNPAGDPTSVSPSGASNFTAIPAVGTVFIHVYRANASAPPDCNAYKLSIQE